MREPTLTTHRAIQLADLMDRASYNRVRFYCNAIKASDIGNRSAATHFTALAQQWERIRIRCLRRLVDSPRKVTRYDVEILSAHECEFMPHPA